MRKTLVVILLTLSSCSNSKDSLTPDNIKFDLLSSENVTVYYFKTYSFEGDIDFNSLKRFPYSKNSFGDCEKCSVVRWTSLTSDSVRDKVLERLNYLNKYDNKKELGYLISLLDHSYESLYYAAYIVDNQNYNGDFYKYIFILDCKNRKLYELDYDERS